MAVKAVIALPRETAAALHALAESYAADERLAGTEFGQSLDQAIQPIRDVLTHEECVEATEQLRACWPDDP